MIYKVMYFDKKKMWCDFFRILIIDLYVKVLNVVSGIDISIIIIYMWRKYIYMRVDYESKLLGTILFRW